MNKTIDLLYRLRLGHSQRQINRETGIARKTIRKYFNLAQREGWLHESIPLPWRMLAVLESTKGLIMENPPLCTLPIGDWLNAKYPRGRMLVLQGRSTVSSKP